MVRRKKELKKQKLGVMHELQRRIEGARHKRRMQNQFHQI